MPDYRGPEYPGPNDYPEYPDYGPSNYGSPTYDGGVPNYSEPGRGRRGFEPYSEEASLDALARSDRFIDALAGDHPLPQMGRADYELASLLAGWRDETRYPEPAELVTERQAAAALRRGLNERRGRRSLVLVGSTAAAVLCVGGFGAVVFNAQPGDALYSMRTALFGEPAVARDDQVVLAAQTEMEQVQELIAQGQWEQASEQLTAISSQVETVEDETVRQELQNQWNQLNVQVETRDPNPTVVVTPVLPPDPNLNQTVLPSDSSAVSSSETTTPASTDPSSTETVPTDTSTAPSSSTETQSATTTSAAPTVETSTTVEPSTAVELPPETPAPSTVITPPPPSTPVSVEPPPESSAIVEVPTITTTSVVPVPQVELPPVEIPVAPAPVVEPVAPPESGGDSGTSETG